MTMERTGSGTPGLYSPVLQGVYSAWMAIKRDRLAPSRADFEPEHFHPWWPRMFMLNVIRRDTGEDFEYRYFGTHLQSTSHHVEDRNRVRGDSNELATSQKTVYRWVVKKRKPHRQFMTLKTSLYPSASYERLVLPLSSDGWTVDKLLGAAVYENWPADLMPDIHPL